MPICVRKHREEVGMAKIDDAAILMRAKELCARGGATWEWARNNRPTIDQVGRRKYLALAREQLLEESRDP